MRNKTTEGLFIITEGVEPGNGKAFLLAFVKVTNAEEITNYSPGGSVAAYQGRFLFHVKDAKLSEDFVDKFNFSLLLSFPILDLAEAWIDSGEYKEMRNLRLANSTGPTVVIGKN